MWLVPRELNPTTRDADVVIGAGDAGPQSERQSQCAAGDRSGLEKPASRDAFHLDDGGRWLRTQPDAVPDQTLSGTTNGLR